MKLAKSPLLTLTLAVAMLVVCAYAGDEEFSAFRKVVPFTATGTLPQMLGRISELSGLKIDPDWPSIYATGVKKDATVTIDAPGATVEQLLELAIYRAATKGHPLAWYLDGKVVRISTQERVMQRRTFASLDTMGSESSQKVRPSRSGRDFVFDNTPLGDIVRFFRDTTKVNFDVNWKSLENVGVTKDTPVTLELRNVSPARALDQLTDQLSAGKDKLERIYWVVNDGVVTIASGNALNNELVTRVYDVQDLLVVVPNFKAPRMDVTKAIDQNKNGGDTGGQGIFTQGGDDSTAKSSSDPDDTNIGEHRAKTREALIAAIKGSIGDDMWKPDGKGSITLLNGKLIVSQTLLGYKLMEMSGRSK